MSAFGNLYLLPVPISEQGGYEFIPAQNAEIIKTLTKFIAEDAKTARRFLKGFGYTNLPGAEIFILNEHTKSGEFSALLEPLLKGEDVGLMSDAGCPGIADPGAEVIQLAHKNNIRVIPLVGPSSIVLSIMASGFNGQNFAFVGYLPIDKTQKTKRIKELEQLAVKYQQAQFFIETPYRNASMFDALTEALSPQTQVFVGRDIGAQNQLLLSKTVSEWKKIQKPDLHKVPVVYGIYT
jgi:16S rRNA (cytidine1402-2'-O)-methyltransferase